MTRPCSVKALLMLFSLAALASGTDLSSDLLDSQSERASATGQNQRVGPGDVPAELSAGDWSGIRAQITAGKYKAYPDRNNGFVSANPAHGWQIHYATDGTTTLTPRDAETQGYQLGLKLHSVGFSERQALQQPQGMSADGFTVTYQWTGTKRVRST